MFLDNIANKKIPIIDNKLDAIIVLTGGKNRVKTGLEIFSKGRIDNLFITGVNKTVKKSDIISMWNGKKPLPDCCITLGYDATTTFENALEVKEWLNNKDMKVILLVTSDYHMNRALLEFRNILKNVTIIAHPVKGKRDFKDIQLWKITFSEYNKTLFRSAIIALGFTP